jgi:hypothetical protein
MAGPMQRLGPAAIKGAKMREMLKRAENAPGVRNLAADAVMRRAERAAPGVRGMKKGGMACGYKKGGAIDGVAKKGKTRCRMV